jgi:hypothetical protein
MMIDRMFGPKGEMATVPGTFFCHSYIANLEDKPDHPPGRS